MIPATKAVHVKGGVFDRFVALVTMRGPMHRFDRWLGRTLKIDFYRLDGCEVVAPRGRRFKVADVRAWREVFVGMGVPLVVTEFSNGSSVDWSDKYEHLFKIMRQVAPEREQPWTAI